MELDLPSTDSPKSTGPPIALGSHNNTWIWTEDDGYDLTRYAEKSTRLKPLRLQCETTTVTIDTAKTALVIINMQNLFLSKVFGHTPDTYWRAQHHLLSTAIPAARQARIRIVWINWGLTEEDLETLPPNIFRTFSFRKHFELPLPGSWEIGLDLGGVTPESGVRIQAGKLLYRDCWNTQLHGRFQSAFEQGKRLNKPDVCFYKNRHSGLSSNVTNCAEFLRQQGIQTLLFAGIDTNQSVLSSIQDASSQGFDCILLKDGSATTSPESVQLAVEDDCNWTWGFVSSCENLSRAVREIRSR